MLKGHRALWDGWVGARTKLNPWLLFLGIVSGACSQQSGDVPDLGSAPVDLSGIGPRQSGLTLVAGGIGAIGSRDGSGAAARLYFPMGAAADSAGNLYIADTVNGTIRKLVLATGMVSTIAGTPGMRGIVDGTGAAAQFLDAEGMAADGAGNLYVAEYGGGCVIRKVVVATGVVSTIFGTAGMCGSANGVGTAARFSSPSGMAVDGAGNLYVADSQNQTIRKIVLATGVVSTLAGTPGQRGSQDGIGPQARFDLPHGVALDGAGNLYVADNLNGTIRKIVLATGMVTTVAGTAGQYGSADGVGAAAQFTEPRAVAADGQGNLYVADPGNHTLRKVVLSTFAVSTIVGTAGESGSENGRGAAALLNSPQAVVADGAGNLYVVDTNNCLIRKVTLSSLAVSTVVGAAGLTGSADGLGAAAEFNNPQGAAADELGNLYIADTQNQTIRKIVLATGMVSTIAGSSGRRGSMDGIGAAAQFYGPMGVTADGAGNLYIADTFNATIRKIVLATREVSTLAGSAGMRGSADGPAATARFESPQALAVDGGGNLFVSDLQACTVRKIVLATGEVSTLAGSASMCGSADGTGAAARFGGPQGLAADGAGNLYVADEFNSTIRKIVLATGEVSTLAGNAGSSGFADGTGAAAMFSGPQGLTVDGAGNLYVADAFNFTIRRIALSNASVTTLVGQIGQRGIKLGPLPAQLDSPVAVTMSGKNDIIIVDYTESAVLDARL